MKLALGAAAAVLLTVAPAIVQGRYMHRWGTPADISLTAQRLDDFPRQIGAWTMVQVGEPLDEYVAHELGLAGYVSRVYTNQATGEVVTMLLMIGQSGRLVRHPPDICYAANANTQVGDAKTIVASASEPASEFRLLEYERRNRAAGEHFLVAYGMTADATWSSPRFPRIAFGGSPYVYKLQMLTTLAPGEKQSAGNARLTAFANEFCPVFAQLIAGTNDG